MIKKITLLLLNCFYIFTFGQNPAKDHAIDKIKEALQQYNKTHYLQTVYLHHDKTEYKTGETIWLKGYLFATHTLKPGNISTNLYVDIVNFKGESKQSTILKMENGTGYGQMELSGCIPDGFYQIIAYTNWMRNHGQEYFFRQKIRIHNPGRFVYTIDDKKLARKTLRQAKDIQVSFMPKQNPLLSGVKNTLQVKITNGNGIGIKANAKLLDKKKNIIAEFNTAGNGVGQCDFTPKKDQKYKLAVIYQNKKKRFKLPEIQERGIIFHVKKSANYVHIEIINNRKETKDPTYNKMILVGQSHNKIYFAYSKILEKDTLEIKISKEEFPNGITRLILMNGYYKAVYSMFFFIPPPKEKSIALKEIKKIGDDTVELVFNKNTQQNLNASIAIKTSKKANFEKLNIKEHMLLAPNINITLSDKAVFNKCFNESEYKKIHMLINGYDSNLDWDVVMTNKKHKPKHHFERKLEVHGKITHSIIKTPVKEATARLTILNEYNDTYQTKTGDDGKFHFFGLDYTDTVFALVEGTKPNGGENPLVFIDSFFVNHRVTVYNPTYILSNYKKRLKYLNNSQKIRDKRTGKFTLHKRADYVFYMEDYNTDVYTNAYEFLNSRTVGVFKPRGQSYLNRSSYGGPLVLLNGSPMGASILFSIAPNDLELIEVTKGPTAIYGMRGANGIIALYSKDLSLLNRGQQMASFVGFSKHKKFEIYDHATENPGYNYTIYWEPQVITNSNTFSVRFHKKKLKRIHLELEGFSGKRFISFEQRVLLNL